VKDLLSRLPAVDRLLRHPALASLPPNPSRAIVLRAAREVLEEARAAVLGAPEAVVPAIDELAVRVRARAERLARPGLRRVLNATGIVVHTNLGRSLLSERAVAALTEAARNYVTLEYDLETGLRTTRQAIVRAMLIELTGAGDALVVNNNAAAVMLALNSLADGREVIISRGELVEIGGSFRLPDVMAKSGARMVEVGTTNRTRLADYAVAVTGATGALLKVHRSNFALRGFTAEVGIAELAGLARERGIPLIHDLGSGALVDFRSLGAAAEHMPRESLASGADVVTFSGDKLLGGPQAGVIAGEAGCIRRIAANPLMRAMRVDKLILAALEATLAAYRDGAEVAARELPTLAMIGADPAALERRTRDLAGRLASATSGGARVEVVPGESEAGGGSLPGEPIRTRVVAVRAKERSPDRVQTALREGEPPVVAIIRDDAVVLDLRTVAPADDALLIALVARAVGVGDRDGDSGARGAPRAPAVRGRRR